MSNFNLQNCLRTILAAQNGDKQAQKEIENAMTGIQKEDEAKKQFLNEKRAFLVKHFLTDDFVEEFYKGVINNYKTCSEENMQKFIDYLHDTLYEIIVEADVDEDEDSEFPLKKRVEVDIKGKTVKEVLDSLKNYNK